MVWSIILLAEAIALQKHSYHEGVNLICSDVRILDKCWGLNGLKVTHENTAHIIILQSAVCIGLSMHLCARLCCKLAWFHSTVNMTVKTQYISILV